MLHFLLYDMYLQHLMKNSLFTTDDSIWTQDKIRNLNLSKKDKIHAPLREWSKQIGCANAKSVKWQM